MPNATEVRALSTTAAGLAFAYLLLSTTTGFGWIDSWHDEQRATQVVLLVGVAAIAAMIAVRRLPHVPFGRSVIAVLALGIVSAIASPHTLDGLAEVSLTALLCAVAMVTALFVRTARSDPATLVARAALLLAAGHVVGAAARYVAVQAEGNALGAEVWLVGFSNPRVASAFYALTAPMVALATLPSVEADRRLRSLGWVTLIGLWTVATGLEARALWFAYVLALPALAVALPSTGTRRLVFSLAGAAAVGAILLWMLPMPAPSSAAAPTAARDLLSPSSRDVLWRLALDATCAAPLLGIGPGGFAHLGSVAGAHPHNWVLQVAAEWGLPALALTLAGLLALLPRVRAAHRLAMGNDALLAVSALAVLVGLSSGLVDGTLVMPTSQAAFAVAFGLMLGALPATAGPASATPWRVSATACSAVAAAALLAFHAVSSYAGQEVEKAAFREQFPGRWLAPRFWENGVRVPPVRPESGR